MNLDFIIFPHLGFQRKNRGPGSAIDHAGQQGGANKAPVQPQRTVNPKSARNYAHAQNAIRKGGIVPMMLRFFRVAGDIVPMAGPRYVPPGANAPLYNRGMAISYRHAGNGEVVRTRRPL